MVKSELDVIILAGGKGKRMRSDIPKPLQRVNGVPTITRIVESVIPLSKKPIIIIGEHSKAIIDATENKYSYVMQKEQRGTGHAVLAVRNALKESHVASNVIVLPGDHPLVSTKTLQNLYDAHLRNDAIITIGTLRVPNFDGNYECFSHYGRIKRGTNGAIQAIVEVKDAAADEKNIHEVNVSYYCFNTEWLWKNIANLKDDNAARELYLTDTIKLAIEQNIPICTYPIDDFREGMGFNTPEELARIERLQY